MELSDCTKEPFPAKACPGDFIARLSLRRTACSRVFKFLYKALAYLKVNAQLGRFRRQRKQEFITPCVPSISTTHGGEYAELFAMHQNYFLLNHRHCSQALCFKK